ncbi:competence system response regulator transcription factor ComE [Streptococcus cristatus]|uniref:competence system response regulator transcription factor ComE n=1 Tax=Streptococcus cristatus TaxID=45634 RepID=UPI0022850F0E|nr:competence system response regulator transcription factor ComE [Streptococcus cristatus]MCY7216652.1 competence system response regulator transcription factor ComE [Streptococcus cristatus]
MRILALEDTLSHQVRMETILAEIADEMGLDIQVKITGKIQEFKEYVENEDVNQIYFLDIDIKGEETKGLEVARFIRHHNPYAIIVFVTSKSEFATMTFKYKVSALDFIDKDINDTSFKKRIKDCIIYTKNTLIANTNMVDYFEYSYRGNDVRVPFNDILYIETSGSSHKLRIVGKNFIKEFYGTISSVQEQDEKTKRFFSSHKSFLANIDNIRDYDKKTKEIVFYEGHRCPVSRLRIKYLKEILKNKSNNY